MKIKRAHANANIHTLTFSKMWAEKKSIAFLKNLLSRFYVGLLLLRSSKIWVRTLSKLYYIWLYTLHIQCQKRRCKTRDGKAEERNFSHKNCFQLLVHQKIHIISADYILNRCKVFSGYYCSCSVFLFYILCRFSPLPAPFYPPLSLCPILPLFAHPFHCFSFISLIISPLCNNI